MIRLAIILLLSIAVAGCRAAPVEPGTASVTETIPSPGPTTVEATVYFTDSARYARAEPPYETAVTRTVPGDDYLPAAVLTQFFQGPTEAEQARDLEAITSGFTGFSRLTVTGGVAHVYLEGPCASRGATYTVAQPIIKNLLQFSEIQTVKIYDAEATTSNPDGPEHSIPFCLEP